MSKFEAVDGKVKNLIAGNTYIEKIATGSIRTESGTFRSHLYVYGYSVSYKRVDVDGQTFWLLGR